MKRTEILTGCLINLLKNNLTLLSPEMFWKNKEISTIFCNLSLQEVNIWPYFVILR